MRHRPKSAKKPPNALSKTETNRNQYWKNGINQPVLLLPRLLHPLPSDVTRGLWAHLPRMYLTLSGRQFSMSLSHFCMPCEQSLTAIGSRLYEIMSFSEQSAGMLAANYLRSSSLVFKLWVPLLPCISLCARVSPGPLFTGVQGTSIRKCKGSCYCYCCELRSPLFLT